MNSTVTRIVELMFQDVEMNEEVMAIHDEVMNNCQDRYNDLIAAGMPEDDAVAIVVESLKGMEDVIAQYKKKNVHRPAQANSANLNGEQNAVFSAAEVQKIDLLLVNEDVTVEASADSSYHVCWNADSDPAVCVSCIGGVLKIERDPHAADNKKERSHVHFTAEGENVRVNEVENTLEGIGGMLEQIGRSLGSLFSRAGMSFAASMGVTVQIPEHAAPAVKLITTSGDIEVTDVRMSQLHAVSTSGDVTVSLNEDNGIAMVELRTTSGDVDATIFAQKVNAGSTSGDVEIEGRITELTASTISGDIDVRADVVNVSFKAISGDVDIALDSDEIRGISGSTISGDIDIDLPSGIGCIQIGVNTRSGDVTTRYNTNGFGPTVSGSVSSMSGDITIR